MEAGGLRLHYLDWGDLGNRPLVLLHGLEDCAHNWGRVASQLSDGYRAVALDHRGHGDSDWAPSGVYTLEGYVADVEALVARLGLERMVLVGHSAGGRAAIAYAARYSGLVEALVAVDCYIGPAPQAGDRPSASVEWDSLDAVVEHLRSQQPGSSAETLESQASNLTFELGEGRRAWRSDPAVLRGQDHAGLWGEWSGLRCPVLIVRGRQSSIMSHESAVRMREAAPHARLAELEGAGHWVHQEIPGAFETTVRWFLQGLAA